VIGALESAAFRDALLYQADLFDGAFGQTIAADIAAAYG